MDGGCYSLNIFIKLALVVSFGFVGGKIARKLNLPDVTGFLIGGLFLGPSFLNIIEAADGPMINFINEVAPAVLVLSVSTCADCGSFLIIHVVEIFLFLSNISQKVRVEFY